MAKYPEVEKILADAAFTRDKALQALDALQFPIAIHLILLFSFPQSETAKGWRVELNGWRLALVRKSEGKKGSKNLKYSTLENGIWEEPLGEDHDRVARLKEIRKDKGLEVPSLEPRLDEFKKFVYRFIDSVFQDFEF